MGIRPLNRKSDTHKVGFYDDDVANKRDFKSSSEIIVSLGDFKGMWEKMHTRGMVLGKEMQKEEDWWSSVMKKSCAWQTHGSIKEKQLTMPADVKQKLIVGSWEKYRKYERDVKVIPWEV